MSNKSVLKLNSSNQRANFGVNNKSTIRKKDKPNSPQKSTIRKKSVEASNELSLRSLQIPTRNSSNSWDSFSLRDLQHNTTQNPISFEHDQASNLFEEQSNKLYKIVNYMLTTYGNESVCINIPFKAYKDLAVEEPDKYLNFNDFKIPTRNTGIYLIRIDIYMVEHKLYLQNSMLGSHIHALLLIYDSNTQEYQILSASNGCYTLKEYYEGNFIDCNNCDLSEFSNTVDLLKDRAKKKFMHDPVSMNDKKSFIAYHDSDEFPRYGNDFKKIIKLIKSVSSSYQKQKPISIDSYSLDEKHILNLMCGFDNFTNDINFDPSSTYYFAHNVERDNDVSYIEYSIKKCDKAKLARI